MTSVSKTLGRCMSCTDDLHLGRQAEGLEAVKESCYRRLKEPPGNVPGAPTYGLGIDRWVNGRSTTTDIAKMPVAIRGQLLLDERVADVTTDVTWNASTSTLRLGIHVTTRDGVEFDLIFEVSDAGAKLL